MALAEDANQQPGQSKSAKRRAAKKANAAAAGEETQEAVKPPVAAAKAEPATVVKAEANAKAKAKTAAKPAEPAPTPVVSEPEPKAKAKAKAKAKVEPKAPEPKAPEPKAPEPKAEPKAKAKAEAKAAAKPAAKPKAEPKPVVEEPPKKEVEVEAFVQLDDGTGGDWEVSSGLSKKQQKRKERIEEDKQAKTEQKATGGKPIPGLGPQHIPGMAPDPKAKAKAKAAGPDPLTIVQERTAANAAPPAPETKESLSTVTIKVPDGKIGIVIGPKGSKIKLIQEKTGVKGIDTTGEVFTITGPPSAVSQAEIAIKELIEKGYTSLSFEDFTEQQVPVHPSAFPDLIGKKGAVIRAIKDELGVEISIPEVPKNSPASKKFKVTVAGSTAKVEEAKVIIQDILMYSHHKLTHPDQVHEELDVQEWQYKFLIGKAGSELRHIQNNYKVRVNIPREHSLNQKVVVVGDEGSVERAKAYIEKLLWNAEHAQRGRDRTDDGDVWGEEEEEDWMKAYMYKR